MSILLTQTEADAFMAMAKRATEMETQLFPAPGGRLAIPLESLDRSEDFLLDVSRSRLDFSKITYQNRARVVVVLLRLDLHGPPHRNPDDVVIPCPHLHVYRQGFGDRWAHAVPDNSFSDLSDRVQTLSDFMTLCNVTEKPEIQAGLF